MQTRVKLCGTTSLADAELAAAAGAWALGLIFHPGSPRRCAPETAAAIGAAMKRRLEVVGVFVNAPLDEVVSTAEQASLTLVQLHGEEGPSYCEEIRRRTGLGVIKAVRVRNAAAVRELSAFPTDFHLLDAYVPGVPGGTGERFDWALASEHPRQPPLLLSGGITPENAAEAIDAAAPFAIDVATGVEAEPGRKDPEKVEHLLEVVRAAAPARA